MRIKILFFFLLIINYSFVYSLSTDFKIIFQNPSYILDRDQVKDIYQCDQTKNECKINFKLDNLDNKNISSTFACSIDFGFNSGEESKCNPKTIIFPEGKHDITFKVSEKKDSGSGILFTEKNIIIENNVGGIYYEFPSNRVLNGSNRYT